MGLPYWITQTPESSEYVGIKLVSIRLTSEELLLPTAAINRIPELAHHNLVVAPRPTVFVLSRGEFQAINRVWSGDFDWDTDWNENSGEEEGARRLVTHRRIERSRVLITDKKEAFRRQHGRLHCEVCRQDFPAFYGAAWNERAIEVHHLKPLGKLAGREKTTLSDLIVVCSNCHAIIHHNNDVEANLSSLRQWFAGRA